jgi:hypothetical protein
LEDGLGSSGINHVAMMLLLLLPPDRARAVSAAERRDNIISNVLAWQALSIH